MDIKRDIQAVVMDLDGTLLNEKHQLSDKNKEAIRKTIEQGVKVFLATGKTRVSAESIIAALALDTPGVYVQGLILYNADGSVRNQTLLDKVAARRIIQYADSEGFTLTIYSGNRILMKRLNNTAKEIAEFGEPKPEAVGTLVNHVDTVPIHKIVVWDDNSQRLRGLRWQLDQQVGDQVSFTDSAVLTALEILPKGASKGKGVKTLLTQMNIVPEKVMAIGDGNNDIEMLKFAGFAVAMGNASDGLKAVADEVVSSNDDDGVAEALEKFVLKKEKKAEPEPAKTEPDKSSETKAEGD